MKVIDVLRRAIRNSEPQIRGGYRRPDHDRPKIERAGAAPASQAKLTARLIGSFARGESPLRGYVPEEAIAKYPVVVAPIYDIPYPVVDLALPDPLPATRSPSSRLTRRAGPYRRQMPAPS